MVMMAIGIPAPEMEPLTMALPIIGIMELREIIGHPAIHVAQHITIITPTATTPTIIPAITEVTIQEDPAAMDLLDQVALEVAIEAPAEVAAVEEAEDNFRNY